MGEGFKVAEGGAGRVEVVGYAIVGLVWFAVVGHDSGFALFFVCSSYFDGDHVGEFFDRLAVGMRTRFLSAVDLDLSGWS